MSQGNHFIGISTFLSCQQTSPSSNMPPRLSMPSFLSTLSPQTPDSPISTSEKGLSRPNPSRALSAGLPLPITTNTNHNRNLQPPITAPPLSSGPLNNPVRGRAHTISVSLRGARSPSVAKSPSINSADRGSPVVEQREKQGASGDSRRLSISGMQRLRGGTPVSVDIPSENRELHDEAVGVLDVIDDHVSTGKQVYCRYLR